MGINPNDVLLNTWQRLDEYYEIIVTAKPDSEMGEVGLLTAKAKARAYSEVLADFMPPFFDNADDIIREAKRRYKAKIAGEVYETPGLGSQSLDRFDAMPKAEKMAEKTKPVPVFDEKLTATIKMARDSGMFTAAQLARSYDTTADHIKSL